MKMLHELRNFSACKFVSIRSARSHFLHIDGSLNYVCKRTPSECVYVTASCSVDISLRMAAIFILCSVQIMN